MKKLVWIFFLWGFVWSQDALTPFAASVSGSLSPEGTSGFYSTPARVGAPAVFMSCEVLYGREELGCGGGGEFLVQSQRISFFSIYHQMDSLFYQIYSELAGSYHWNFLVAGGAYGYSMEWTPGQAKWSRHRYKGGLSLLWGNMYVGAMIAGWLSPFENTWDVFLGAGVRMDGLGNAYFQWDGSSFILGNQIVWNNMTLETSYQFPDFGVGLRIRFSLGWWNPSGAYGFSSGKWSWFGFGGSRKI